MQESRQNTFLHRSDVELGHTTSLDQWNMSISDKEPMPSHSLQGRLLLLLFTTERACPQEQLAQEDEETRGAYLTLSPGRV